MKIIAIGGGGFTHETFPELDDFCLSHVEKSWPRVAYIGTASDDEPVKIERFKSCFAGRTSACIHLPMTLSSSNLSAALADVDLVYVGGGDTEQMVAQWRTQGWDLALVKAYQSGVVLAGTSAGAVCWFDQFLFNSRAGPMRPLAGLGLISMGACPHYSSETPRRTALHHAVTTKTMPATIAIDDGVAVAFERGQPIEVCIAEAGANAHFVKLSAEAARAQEAPLEL